MLRVGRYLVERRLATGGMAEVLLARDPAGVKVALKRVLPHLLGTAAVVRRFVDEARTLAGLGHPHVVALLDCFDDRGRPVLVLEHVDGVDLRTLLARARMRGLEMPPAAARAIVAATAAALDHVHARGVVHGDLKASNLLLSFDGRVKLGDFGIAVAGSGVACDDQALAALARRLGAYGSSGHAPGDPEELAAFVAKVFPVEERAALEAVAPADDATLRLPPHRAGTFGGVAVAALLIVGLLRAQPEELSRLGASAAAPLALELAPTAMLPMAPAPPRLELGAIRPRSDNGWPCRSIATESMSSSSVSARSAASCSSR